MSVRARVLAAVGTALSGVTEVPAANVFRARPHAVPETKLPAIAWRRVDEEPAKVGNLTQKTLSLAFEILTTGEGATGENAADTIEADLVAVLTADRTLGDAAVTDTRVTGVTWDLEDADGSHHQATVSVAVTYRTATGEV